MKKAVRLFSAVMYIAVVAAAALIIYYNVRLPDKYYVTKGGTLEFQGDVSILAAVNYPSGDSDETAAGFSTDSSGDISFSSGKPFASFTNTVLFYSIFEKNAIQYLVACTWNL